MKNRKIRVGDYVYINDNVHDSSMPPGRRDGLIVEILGQYGWNRDPDQVVVMFSNGAFLKFHESQVTVSSKLMTKNCKLDKALLK